MQVSARDLWILTAVTIINITTIIGIIRWGIKMIIGMKCSKIINDFNKIYRNMDVIHKSELRPLLKNKYKMWDWTAIRCIKYLKENGYIIDDRINDSELHWIVQ